MKNQNQPNFGFADLAISKRKVKDEFFNQIDLLIDWRPISHTIRKYYQKGESAVGRPSYDGLVLFKICLLQTWYGLSDYEVEDQVNDRISFSKFVGISLDDKAPDHSVISRFRTALTQRNTFEKLLTKINNQLESKQVIVKRGIIVDASVTDTPRKPKGKKEFQVAEDRKEEEQIIPSEPIKLEEKVKPGVDTDGKWIKKAGKLRFGYKQHTATDEQGLILAIVTTSANQSDTKFLEDVLKKVKPKAGTWVKADKGYKSADNDKVITKMRLKNHIMRKTPKNKSLTQRETLFNKLISKTRYKIERTFGSIQRWFNSGTARYVGLAKMHSQHLLEAIAYNLYSSPGIIVSNCKN